MVPPPRPPSEFEEERNDEGRSQAHPHGEA